MIQLPISALNLIQQMLTDLLVERRTRHEAPFRLRPFVYTAILLALVNKAHCRQVNAIDQSCV